MRGAALTWLAISALGAGGCASILGIEEQTFDGTDGGQEGGGLDASGDTSIREDAGALDATADTLPGADSAAGDSAAVDTGPPACSSGALSCNGQQPTICTGGVFENNGAACGGTTLCLDGACTAPPPSCAQTGAGTTSCGANSESCCTNLPVAGGSYDRTYVNGGGGPTGGSDPATVSSLRLDKYEVTVARFRSFVAAWSNGLGYTPAAGSGTHAYLHGGMGLVDAVSGGYESGWLAADDVNVAPTDGNLGACEAATWTPSAGANETLPINCIDWYEAYAFCIWDGGFLPSESEWNYAAAGGSDQRAYPWSPAFPPGSTSIDCTQANYDGCPTGVVHTVGSESPAGDGKWGQADLAGNVWEWNLDWNESSYVTPCADCANLTAASFRVLRGGSFGNTPPVLLVSFRDLDPPEYRGDLVGVRCARAP
jgi:formylglycine-generating enzyme required for sulfatase activity